MELEHRFVIDARPQDVWDLLLDLETVAPCLPGAEIVEQLDDRRYVAKMSVRVGPMLMSYQGQIALTEVDETARRCLMRAEAKEARGRGTAKADIATTIGSEGSRTEAAVLTDLTLTGRTAQLGRSVIQDAANAIVADFGHNLSALAHARTVNERNEDSGPAADHAPGSRAPRAGNTASAPSAPVGALSLLFRILKARLHRLLTRSRRR